MNFCFYFSKKNLKMLSFRQISENKRMKKLKRKRGVAEELVEDKLPFSPPLVSVRPTLSSSLDSCSVSRLEHLLEAEPPSQGVPQTHSHPTMR